MKQILQSDWLLVIILLLLSIFFLWGTQFIPFHPDESTQLYMSSDFEALLKNPGSLFWQPQREGDPRQRYRELDAPITKYLLGLGRWIAGRDALPVDWNWAASWQGNLDAGAYPDAQLFRVSRVTITLMLPLSTFLIYLIGKRLQGRSTGLLAAILLGTNAVVLFHGRRAMAEGTLLLATLFAVWSFLKARQSPWLVGLGMGLAFNAKQSALALLPVALIALVWLPPDQKQRPKKIASNLFQFAIVFTTVILVLNPLYWRHPIMAARSAIQARGDLMERQIADTRGLAPDKVQETSLQRVGVLFLNLFISPPEYGLIENLRPTLEDIEIYLAIPGHNLFRGIIWGAVFFSLTFLGFYLALRRVIIDKTGKSQTLIILLLATLFQAVGLVAAVPLYWIRYTIPLVPFTCLWMAYALTYRKGNPPSDND